MLEVDNVTVYNQFDKPSNNISFWLCNVCGQPTSISYWLFSPSGVSGTTENRWKKPMNRKYVTYSCANADIHTPAALADNQGWSAITSRCESCGGFRSVRAIYYMHDRSQHVKDSGGGVWKCFETYSDIPPEQHCGTADVLIPAATQRTEADVSLWVDATCSHLKVFNVFFCHATSFFKKHSKLHFGICVEHVTPSPSS